MKKINLTIARLATLAAVMYVSSCESSTESDNKGTKGTDGTDGSGLTSEQTADLATIKDKVDKAGAVGAVKADLELADGSKLKSLVGGGAGFSITDAAAATKVKAWTEANVDGINKVAGKADILEGFANKFANKAAVEAFAGSGLNHIIANAIYAVPVARTQAQFDAAYALLKDCRFRGYVVQAGDTLDHASGAAAVLAIGGLQVGDFFLHKIGAAAPVLYKVLVNAPGTVGVVTANAVKEVQADGTLGAAVDVGV